MEDTGVVSGVVDPVSDPPEDVTPPPVETPPEAAWLDRLGVELPLALLPSADGTLVRVGYSEENVDLPGGGTHLDTTLYLSRLTPSGDVLWERTIDQQHAHPFLSSARLDSEGHIYIVYYTDRDWYGGPTIDLGGGPGPASVAVGQFLLAKYDVDGTFLWSRELGTCPDRGYPHFGWQAAYADLALVGDEPYVVGRFEAANDAPLVVPGAPPAVTDGLSQILHLTADGEYVASLAVDPALSEYVEPGPKETATGATVSADGDLFVTVQRWVPPVDGSNDRRRGRYETVVRRYAADLTPLGEFTYAPHASVDGDGLGDFLGGLRVVPDSAGNERLMGVAKASIPSQTQLGVVQLSLDGDVLAMSPVSAPISVPTVRITDGGAVAVVDAWINGIDVGGHHFDATAMPAPHDGYSHDVHVLQLDEQGEVVRHAVVDGQWSNRAGVGLVTYGDYFVLASGAEAPYDALLDGAPLSDDPRAWRLGYMGAFAW